MNYYFLQFALKQHHNWSINEIESMYPFERDIYVGLLQQHLEEKAKRNAQHG